MPRIISPFSFSNPARVSSRQQQCFASRSAAQRPQRGTSHLVPCVTACAKRGMLAQVFVVADIADVGNRVKLAATLLGGYVVIPVTLTHGQGPGIKYHSSLASRRKVWLSDRFVAKHTAIASIIRGASVHARAAKLPMKWTFLLTEAEFREAKAQAAAIHAALRVLGVATAKEQKAALR